MRKSNAFHLSQHRNKIVTSLFRNIKFKTDYWLILYKRGTRATRLRVPYKWRQICGNSLVIICTLDKNERSPLFEGVHSNPYTCRTWMVTRHSEKVSSRTFDLQKVGENCYISENQKRKNDVDRFWQLQSAYQCCTLWPWPFSRSNTSNVNISKMVRASVKLQEWH